MNKSEAFKKAAVAVLSADMAISVKQEVIGVLLWEEYFAKICEDKKTEEVRNENLR